MNTKKVCPCCLKNKDTRRRTYLEPKYKCYTCGWEGSALLEIDPVILTEARRLLKQHLMLYPESEGYELTKDCVHHAQELFKLKKDWSKRINNASVSNGAFS